MAVYYHAELDIVIICHVDDPWIDVGLGAENEHLTDQDAITISKSMGIMQLWTGYGAAM